MSNQPTQYKDFEEWRSITRPAISYKDVDALDAWHARDAEIRALRDALEDAASSLETVARSGGKNGDPLLQHPSQIRGYANSRAISARNALKKG